ncbi:HD domain-containing protein [Blastopirellula sp. J2-11]|uniref:HD domain-containing protein n=1 Tax=Blastopirellula sp. J2-11 TaxID=2943192 RepID=UPI0021C6D95C|nr:HD domain-containing protein [Blastopirellula sp. J2-11]UUO08444.1 HD domain-containing protein [Blastopirellula sp. J2-11]
MNDEVFSISNTLGDLLHGERGDIFVQLVSREEAVTRSGRLYIRVEFRDDRRRATVMLWEDSPWLETCRLDWKIGEHFKIRAIYTESAHGRQLRLQKIRPVTDDDVAQGFDPVRCQPRSVEEPADLFETALAICRHEIKSEAIRELVTAIYTQNREPLLIAPAGMVHHHRYQGGLLEHSISVAQTVLELILQYRHQYPILRDPLTCDLAIAGALTHDLGKLREIDLASGGVSPTPDGQILGHVLLGRDLVRDACQTLGIALEHIRRLELIFLTHQDYYADGDYRRPISIEALLVQQADRIDSELHRFAAALESPIGGSIIPADNPLRRAILRSEAAHD